METTPISVDPQILADVAQARYHDPHSVLGAHVGDGSITIRTVKHLADEVQIVTPGGSYDAVHEQDGVWVATVPGQEVPSSQDRKSVV